MSVNIRGLTKVYGKQRAVDNISFTAKKGEILGFIGPNGAGKSTTMKIITCFLSPTEGEVDVCGFDVSKSPDEVRKLIGYLPEHNPLYKDMYVKEFLHFIAKIHKIKNASIKVDEMIELTGLGVEQHKKIQQLSKGYKQRVGLAQALIHDPEVLILDEHTSGLDPNQLAEIRALIKKISKDKVVIFSSHFMQEVEGLCDRVVLINKGQIIADADLQDLIQKHSPENQYEVVFEKSVKKGDLSALRGIKKVSKTDDHSWLLVGENKVNVTATILQAAREHHWGIKEVKRHTMKLEEIFNKLTK